MNRSHAKRNQSENKKRVDALIRSSKPYFLLEKQCRILEVQNNHLVVTNQKLGQHILALEKELKAYRDQANAKPQTAAEIEQIRQERLAFELAT